MNNPVPYIICGILLFLMFIFGVSSCSVIDPGHVGVVTFMGSVEDRPLLEGVHFVNPFASVTRFDTKQRSHKEEKVTVPSRDQLITTLDVSVQYHLIGSMASQVLRETGNEHQLLEVQLVPKLRSALREAGKSLEKAEDFFNESMQMKMQADLRAELGAYLQPKGIEIQDVLFRDISLPPVVATAVQAKKQREQLAVQQQAELQRFTVEQQQKIATAEAERKAAEQESAKIRVLADARAYEIEAINKAAAGNPTYVQLQALKALGDIAKDPAAKLYFLNSDSQTPLPLLHLGDGTTAPHPIPKAAAAVER